MDKNKIKSQTNQKSKIKVQQQKVDKRKLLIYLSLILFLTIIVYSDSLNNGFVPWDDNVHIYNNKDIQGLDAAHMKRIFSTNDVYLYHPFTILTWAINYKFWGHSSQTNSSDQDDKYKVWNGLNPLPFHVENLILHLLNIVLVFYLIFLLTKRAELAAFVALFFGIHPMHVESVAWATGLKDVLYSFFYLAALITYVIYKQNNGKIQYLILLLYFVHMFTIVKASRSDTTYSFNTH